MVEYSATTPRFSAASPNGRSRSINRVLWPDSWARDTAKLQASMVTPSPPLAPRNTRSRPPVFFGRCVAGRLAVALTSASAMVLCAKGNVRNSRAPAQGPARFDPYSTDSGDFTGRLTAADRPNGDRLSAGTSY